MSYLPPWETWAGEGGCRAERKCPCSPEAKKHEGMLFGEATGHGLLSWFQRNFIIMALTEAMHGLIGSWSDSPQRSPKRQLMSVLPQRGPQIQPTFLSISEATEPNGPGK